MFTINCLNEVYLQPYYSIQSHKCCYLNIIQDGAIHGIYVHSCSNHGFYFLFVFFWVFLFLFFTVQKCHALLQQTNGALICTYFFLIHLQILLNIWLESAEVFGICCGEQSKNFHCSGKHVSSCAHDSNTLNHLNAWIQIKL